MPGKNPNGSAEDPFRLSVDVEMVVLQATVHTKKGNFVNGLRQNSFQLFEDNKLQTLKLFRHSDSPVAVGLIVDNSGSMRRKHAAVLAAAKAFTRSSNQKDELFVVNFNEQVILGLPHTRLYSADSRELARALPATVGGGKTALYDALEVGLQRVRELKQDKKALIVITDGGDNASTHTVAQVMNDFMAADVMIYTIGLFDKNDLDSNPGVLNQMAEATGGQSFYPKKPAQAVSSCKLIAKTIRSQYTLGYSPTDTSHNGAFRTLQLKVTSPRRVPLVARTRSGYIATAKLPQ